MAIVFGLPFVAGGTDLWSLQPVAATPPPEAAGSWAKSDIDRFIAAALEREGWTHAPKAGRRVLIRRASYDLTGLPPDREAVEAFVADPRSDAEAFRDAVDALLASPQYGERWGRHWLDVVRYADTAGENSDHPVEDAWRYRNWVIDALNSDMPYDRFVRKQLAGDILAVGEIGSASTGDVIATGYLAIGRRFGHKIEESMHLTYEDVIDNIGKAFLGLSVSCARCHDHKHDPITTRDYYALYGVLASTRFPYPGCEPQQQPRDFVPLATPELIEKHGAWKKRRDDLAKAAAAIDKETVRKSNALKEVAAKCSRLLSSGDVPDGGAVDVTPEPLMVTVRKDEAIQISVLPRGNYGADTTILEFELAALGGEEPANWSVADLIDDLSKANPHSAAGAEWCFLDTSKAGPRLLSERNLAVEGKGALHSWSIGGTPSVLVNRSNDPVKVWTTLPARTFYVHPGPSGPVAVAWISPVDGEIGIRLKVTDGHPGGDGVAWRLEHFADPAMADAYRELGAGNMRKSELDAHASSEPQFPLAYAVAEGKPQNARVQKRGDHEDPGDEVPRAFLSALGGGALGDDASSGRLELARRITAPDNPLTARVMVNRIWAGHFGRGLVTTLNDFGTHGARPTHPELLDFLARRFISEGWSMKAIHRLIMHSATYRRSASDNITAASYAGFARRRLSAEELRDTLLTAAGTLDRSPGEGHPFPARGKWKFTQHAPFADDYATTKRSVYVMRKRNRATPFYALFDGPDPNAITAERDLTIVPTQALYFMNDPFFHECADKFAARVRAASDPLDFACRELYARPASHEDIAAFEEFSNALGNPDHTELWNSYARILLASNELLFLD